MKKKLFALLMALVMVLSLAACGGDKGGDTQAPADSGASTGTEQPSDGGDAAPTTDLKLGYDMDTGENVYGPYYDEWSDMTDEELYEMALKEDTTINVYATSSKMLKEEEPFEEMFPGLDLVVSDLDSDEVLSKARMENETGNITADVLQTKDVNGEVFHEYYDKGVIEPYHGNDMSVLRIYVLYFRR